MAETEGKVTVTSESITIYREGTKNTIEADSWESALELGQLFMTSNMTPQGGGPDPEEWFNWEPPEDEADEPSMDVAVDGGSATVSTTPEKESSQEKLQSFL